MKNKIKKKSSFPKMASIRIWLRRQLLDFLGLLKMIRYYHRYSFKSIKTQTLILFVNGLIFPITRILLGGERSYNFRRSFLRSYSSTSPTIVSLPSPLKSKIIIRYIDFRTYSEILFEDIYSQKTLKPGMNVVDIGAHIGIYSILAAERVGKKGKIIAIEPETQNYKRLLGNIKLNNLQNVTLIKIALTDHEGIGKLYLSPSSGGHSLSSKGNTISSIEVPLKTLDILLEELNIKRIDIIKIDAEGAEIPILKGAEKTLKANPNVKIIVASYHYPSETEEVCGFLNKKGFKTKIFHSGIVMTV